MDLLQKIKAGSQAYKDISWPGQAETLIRLRVLNDNDYLQSTLAADKTVPNVSVANVSRYNGEMETQLLYRAITDPESKKSIGTITDFRQLLTPEIKAQLIDVLDALHNEFSPNPDNLSSEEFDKLFEDIKKNAEETVSSVSNIFTLRKLVKYLVKLKK